MNRLVAFLSLAICTVCLGQAPQINPGSTVYVAPMHGYEAYVIAALQKKHVPVVVILDRYKADYIIGGTVDHQDIGQPSVVVNNNNTAVANGNANGNSSFNQGFEAAQRRAAQMRTLGETSTSISVLDPKTTEIVFSYASGKMGSKQLQRTAEDFAGHLKKFIEKEKKRKR